MLASKRSEGTFMDHWGDDFGDGTCSSESGGKTIHICAPTSLRYLPMWVQIKSSGNFMACTFHLD